MKIAKEQKIEMCMSKDETRAHIASAHLDVEKRLLIATNGHTMATIPVQVDAGDTSGPISPDAIKTARKQTRKGEPMEIKAGAELELTNGAKLPRPDLDGMSFPPWEQVMPEEYPDGEMTFCFDARLLWELAQAMGATKGESAQVVCTFKKEDKRKLGLEPIQVKLRSPAGVGGAEPVGVLMPCRK